MTDPRTLAWLDQEDSQVAAVIRTHGCYLQHVGGGGCSYPGCCGEASDGPPFTYTVGLFGIGHPELLVLGLPARTAGLVLNDLFGRVRSGDDLVPGQLLTVAGWPRRVVEELPNPGDILLTADRFYRRPPEAPVPAYQLSYDDPDGRFPWEPGHAEPALQPRPGTFRA